MATSIADFRLALPHPYLIKYRVQQSKFAASSPTFQIVLDENTSTSALQSQLHNANLSFSALNAGEDVAANNNSAWARARRSSSLIVQWTTPESPTLAQLWLVTYVLFSIYADHEQIRIGFQGSDPSKIENDLISVGLAIRHPSGEKNHKELLLQRSTFWQGAGSPFGPRPIWLAESNVLLTSSQTLSTYPSQPLIYTLTNKFPSTPIYSRHPIRPAKPTPGSTIYSRYIPHLSEHFSMVALDYKNATHLNLFHKWQNDPRVAKGWNEEGSLDEHREYLRKLDEDKHVLTILARFEETFFAYFEVYWGKEDTLGAHYPANDYDRGRHSLVGDIRYRGPNRVSAWWSSLMHYILLDEPRTMYIVGEPKATNTRVLAYDLAHGFNIDGWVDFPHKRSAIVRCSRERFFAMCPFGWDEGVDEGVYKADEFLKRVRGSKI